MKKKAIVFAVLVLMFSGAQCLQGQALDSGNSKIVEFRGRGKVRLVKFFDGSWQLMVDGQPYFIKGLSYGVGKIGQSPDNGTLEDWMRMDYNKNGKIDGPYDSWVDENQNNIQDANEPAIGDFQLMKDMGVNTIRLHHHASNKKLLRDLYNNYGIMVIMGDFFGAYTVGSGANWQDGTDYTDKEQRENMKNSVRQMVLDFKDEPYILLWVLGNENNLKDYTRTNAQDYPREYAEFVNEAALMIHRLDPDHPVAICDGDVGLLNYYARFAPEIDIFGTNCYRGPEGFGNLWSKIERILDKPVLIAEYGGSPDAEFRKDGTFDEEIQMNYHKGCWQDILAHSEKYGGNSIGGAAFGWQDGWWKAGDPFKHAKEGPMWRDEWNGICGQGNGKHSPFLRHLRKVYYMYKEAWVNP